MKGLTPGLTNGLHPSRANALALAHMHTGCVCAHRLQSDASERCSPTASFKADYPGQVICMI